MYLLFNYSTVGRKRKKRSSGLLAHEEVRYEALSSMEKYLQQSVPR